MLQKELLQDITLICPFCTPVKSSNECYHFKHAPKFKMQSHTKCHISCFWQGLGVFLKRKREDSPWLHLLSYSLCFGHDSLHFAMLPLTPPATRTRILGSTTHSPRFGGKNWNLLFTVTIHLSLFMLLFCYCLLWNFAYLRGAVPYIWNKCFCMLSSGLLP